MIPEQVRQASEAGATAGGSGPEAGPRTASRRVLLCGGLVCLLASTGGVALWRAGGRHASAAAAPSIVIDEDGVTCNECSWDAGEVDPLAGREVSRRLTVHNALREDVRIEDISVDCGCLLAEEVPEEVKAGATVDVAFRLNVGTNPGPVVRRAQLSFSGAVTESVTLSFTAYVKPVAIMRSTPEAIDFGRVPAGSTEEQSVKLSYLDGSDVAGSGIICAAALDGLRIETVPDRDDGRTLVVRCVLRNDAGTAKLSKDVHAELSVRRKDSSESILEIPVRARLEGVDAHFVRPLSVTISGTEATAGLIRADAPAGMAPAVTGVRYRGDAGLRVSLAPVEGPGGESAPGVTISLDAAPRERYRGLLYLTTDVDGLPEIPVPLSVRMQP